MGPHRFSFIGGKTGWPRLAAILIPILISGCAYCPGGRYPFDFNKFHDTPLTPDVSAWLMGGEQGRITPRIRAMAAEIRGRNRRERLYKAMRKIWQVFTYDGWLNEVKFSRTADELYKSRVLGGCSDFALVEITLFRAVGIPARMILTANVDWMAKRKKDELVPVEGHSFIEVFLEDRWYLVDSTYRWLYSAYDPERSGFPHGEIFCMRGRDFWDMGLRNTRHLQKLLGAFALAYKGDYHEPRYPKAPL